MRIHLRKSDAAFSWISVDEGQLGSDRVYASETCPTLCQANPSVYRRIAERAKRIMHTYEYGYSAIYLSIEPEPGVPFEHVIGILEAVKGMGIWQVTLANCEFNLVDSFSPPPEEPSWIEEFLRR